MADRLVLCRNCGITLDERGDEPPAERPQCPNCGSTAREFQVAFGGTITPIGDVTIEAPAASATATAASAAISIEHKIADGTFTRTVVWSKTPDAWLAEVRDAGGSLVAVEINFDAMDTLVLLAEHLLPPGE